MTCWTSRYAAKHK